MAWLPTMSGREVVKVFESLGWHVTRTRGSHIMMAQAGRTATLAIPDHKEIRKGTLRSLIHKAGLTIDEFVAAI